LAAKLRFAYKCTGDGAGATQNRKQHYMTEELPPLPPTPPPTAEKKSRPLLKGCLITLMILGFSLMLLLVVVSLRPKTALIAGKEKVGVVEIKGMLSDSRPTLKQLDRFKKDSGIKAIVLRVNSPGGAVGPAQEIMREVEKIRKDKKVVASLGTVAASGGYYIAAAADHIIANPGTLTGSIGVIMQFTNVEQLTNKLGLNFLTLKAGRYKDVGNPFRPMTKEEEAYLQGLINNIHHQFMRDVARLRKLTPDKLKPLAEGQVYTGEEAKQVGLVDELGNINDAVDKAGRLAGIKGKIEAVYPEKDRFSFLRLLLGDEAEERLNSMAAFPYPEPAYLPRWFK
jgi:protease-4